MLFLIVTRPVIDKLGVFHLICKSSGDPTMQYVSYESDGEINWNKEEIIGWLISARGTTEICFVILLVDSDEQPSWWKFTKKYWWALLKQQTLAQTACINERDRRKDFWTTDMVGIRVRCDKWRLKLATSRARDRRTRVTFVVRFDLLYLLKKNMALQKASFRCDQKALQTMLSRYRATTENRLAETCTNLNWLSDEFKLITRKTKISSVRWKMGDKLQSAQTRGPLHSSSTAAHRDISTSQFNNRTEMSRAKSMRKRLG